MNENNIKPKDYLKSCNDQEIFEIVNGIDNEIENRIINLFKSHNCSIVYMPEGEEFEVRVNNIYGIHKWEDTDMFEKWVNIYEIGYCTILEDNNKPIDYLYVVTVNGERYSDEEIDTGCLWDLYKEAKDAFEKDS